MQKFVFFDCDSTLSAIEGIDELARLRGPETFAAIEQMTRVAMDGGTAIEEIFARRLELIRPTAAEVAAIGRLYIENVEPDAAATVAALRREGWTPVILSGGFTEAIRPLAAMLGIERVEAVGLRFDTDGNYAGFDRDAPTTRSQGKRRVIARIRAEAAGTAPSALGGAGVAGVEAAAAGRSGTGGSPVFRAADAACAAVCSSSSAAASAAVFAADIVTVMVGDGASDLETAPDVDLFVGFGRYVVREKVRAAAPAFITALGELPPLLAARQGRTDIPVCPAAATDDRQDACSSRVAGQARMPVLLSAAQSGAGEPSALSPPPPPPQ